MDPHDVDRFGTLDGAVDLDLFEDGFDLDVLLEDGGLVPPIPPEPGRQPGRGPAPGRAPGPHPHDDQAFSPWVTLAFAAITMANLALFAVTTSAPASGGIGAATALSIGFAVVFLVPFYVGAVWVGRLREDRS